MNVTKLNRPIVWEPVTTSNEPNCSFCSLAVKNKRRRLLKINADNQNPRRMCAMRVIITLITIIIFGVVFARTLFFIIVPTQFRILNNEIAFRSDNATKGCNPSYFDPKNYLQCSNFSSSNPVLGLLLTELVNSNQFALIYLRLIKNVKDS